MPHPGRFLFGEMISSDPPIFYSGIVGSTRFIGLSVDAIDEPVGPAHDPGNDSM